LPQKSASGSRINSYVSPRREERTYKSPRRESTFPDRYSSPRSDRGRSGHIEKILNESKDNKHHKSKDKHKKPIKRSKSEDKSDSSESSLGKKKRSLTESMQCSNNG